jgi:hypothetical protein
MSAPEVSLESLAAAVGALQKSSPSYGSGAKTGVVFVALFALAGLAIAIYVLLVIMGKAPYPANSNSSSSSTTVGINSSTDLVVKSITTTGDITAGGNVNAPKGNLYFSGGNMGLGSDGGLIINPNGGKGVTVNSGLFVNGVATTQDAIFFPGGSLNKAPSGGAQLNSTGGIVLNNDTTVNGAFTSTKALTSPSLFFANGNNIGTADSGDMQFNLGANGANFVTTASVRENGRSFQEAVF